MVAPQASTKMLRQGRGRGAKTTSRTVDSGRGSGCRGKKVLAALCEGRIRRVRTPSPAAVSTDHSAGQKCRVKERVPRKNDEPNGGRRQREWSWGEATPAATVREGRIAGGGSPPHPPERAAVVAPRRRQKVLRRQLVAAQKQRAKWWTVKGSCCRGRKALAALRKGRMRPARTSPRRRAALVTQTTLTKKLR